MSRSDWRTNVLRVNLTADFMIHRDAQFEVKFNVRSRTEVEHEITVPNS